MTFRPRIRTVLLVVNLVIILLPLLGIQALRLYESELIRQTESALAAQGAVIREQYRAWLLHRLGPKGLETYGHPIDPRFAPRPDAEPPKVSADASGDGAEPNAPKQSYYQPIQPDIEMYRERVRPRAEDAAPSPFPADEDAVYAGKKLNPILQEAQRYTLAGVRIVDHRGVVVSSSRGELGHLLDAREEVQRALAGETIGLLRQRISDDPTPPLAAISRGGLVRVFFALPVTHDGRVLGAIVLSRTPIDIQKALFLNRHVLMRYVSGLLILLLFVSLLTAKTISRPVQALIRQAEDVRMGRDTKPLPNPGSHEIDQLSRAVDQMARTLKDRARYIETFARNVSHEFKTPLATFHGTVELLRDHLDTMSKEERERFLAMLAGDAQRMERLVERLLLLARAEVSGPGGETTPLTPTLEELTRRYAASGLDVRLDVAPELAAAQLAMSREALESTVGNLVENARHHGGKGVKVEIAARSDHAFGAALITVEDDGPGISAANLPRVFDAFFTTARASGGTGLGLSIVKALLEAHGGRVEVTSAGEGRGTQFHLRLPLAAYR